MAKTRFVVSEEVEDLSYDFTKFVKDAAGIIPEPSGVQLNAFRKAISEVTREALATVPDDKAVKALTSRQQFSLVADFLGRDDSVLAEKMAHIAADVCSGTPSFEDISALPARPAQAFYGWLTEVFLRPEASTPATKN